MLASAAGYDPNQAGYQYQFGLCCHSAAEWIHATNPNSSIPMRLFRLRIDLREAGYPFGFVLLFGCRLNTPAEWTEMRARAATMTRKTPLGKRFKRALS